MWAQKVAGFVQVLCVHTVAALASSLSLIGPDVMSFEAVQPVAISLHSQLATLHPQPGLPAPRGHDFEGPDPGLNAAIINVQPTCPSGYMRDFGGSCRPAFRYGPNPFYTFVPNNYKGSVQFYMGMMVGAGVRRRPFRRRHRRPRVRPRLPLGAFPRQFPDFTRRDPATLQQPDPPPQEESPPPADLFIDPTPIHQPVVDDDDD